MTGASRNHARITGNTYAELRAQLRGTPCEAFANDVRVHVTATGLYTYPDVLVACGPGEYTDAERDTLLDPVVLVEVLSPSTEEYDRGGKFMHYDQVPSLREYLLLAQTRMHAEHRVRDGGPGAPWVLTLHDDPDARVALRVVGCTLRLGDLYERVVLPAAPPLRRIYEDAPGWRPRSGTLAAAGDPA
jgi:Uma2 family endonuclease